MKPSVCFGLILKVNVHRVVFVVVSAAVAFLCAPAVVTAVVSDVADDAAAVASVVGVIVCLSLTHSSDVKPSLDVT